jgi:two-component system chemotaxis sensor kinase CheA
MGDTGREDLSGLYAEFLDESRELLDALGRDLVALEQRPDDRDVVNRIFRAAHSLKGNAGFMGMDGLATLAHSMENVLGRVRDGSLDGGSSLLDLLFRGLDCCRTLLSAAIASGQREEAARPEELDALLAALAEAAAQGPAAPAPQAPARVSDDQAEATPDGARLAAVRSESAEPRRVAPGATASAGKPRDGDTIRVSTSRLDRLVNLVGELMATRSQLALISRAAPHRRLDDVATALSRLADQLQEEVLSIRMVQIRSLFQKFHRLVRDTAREAGKEVELELAGEETELDKAIIEAIHDPIVHLVRNAIGHGLEPGPEREAAGKPPAGRLRLAARHAQDHVVVEVSDDGRGIDEASVRRRAVELGSLPASEAETPLSADQVRKLIFSAGFSTAARVDRISGRGVGLDVVRAAVEGLGGSVDLSTRAGGGATFCLRVPLTLAMIQIFLVRVSGQLYGLPLPQIDETIRVAPLRLEAIGGQRIHLLRGQAVPVLSLAEPFGLLPGETGGDGADLRPVVIVRHGDRRVGFLVDEVCGKDKTVLKPLGPYLASLPQPLRGIAGASLLGSGELVLIVDVVGLFGLVREVTGATA